MVEGLEEAAGQGHDDVPMVQPRPAVLHIQTGKPLVNEVMLMAEESRPDIEVVGVLAEGREGPTLCPG